MRELLVLGWVVLGLVVVAASYQDESGIEAKNEGVQGDLVKDREIRSTGGNRKKNKPSLKSTPGVFSALSRPSKTLWKRSVEELSSNQGKRKKCPGCYTSLLRRQPEIFAPAPVIRKQRHSEVHEKTRKKNKHLKEKSKSKRRRNKEHKERERHALIQAEDPEFGQNNNKRRKHHRGKKDKENRHPGRTSAISSFTPDMKNTHMDIRDTEKVTE